MIYLSNDGSKPPFSVKIAFMKLQIPIAKPPWTQLGKKLESTCRKALYDYQMLEEVDTLAIALSGGKDSLTLLYLLHAISGRGFPSFKIHALHVTGEFSCGAGVDTPFLKSICSKLEIDLTILESTQKRDGLECYSCSRERRSLIFREAKKLAIHHIAFGHHRDDYIQTLLLNLFHKAEFSSQLPKIYMKDYGVTILRPLIYISENQIIEFAKINGFQRITCQCPVGQNSKRKTTEKLLQIIEKEFPNIRTNLAQAGIQYGSLKSQGK